MKKSKPIIASAMLAALIAGCAATEPTKADYMRAHAAALQSEVDLRDNLARDWDRGARLVTSGEKRIQTGEEQIAKGKENIEIGNQEILEGRMLMENSERVFKENFPGLKLEP